MEFLKELILRHVFSLNIQLLPVQNQLIIWKFQLKCLLYRILEISETDHLIVRPINNIESLGKVQLLLL